MQYLLIICHDDAFAPTPALIREIHAWGQRMEREGIRKDGRPLRPCADAVTVRVRNGRRAITAGPFTDSGEKMAAYELVECGSLKEAIDVAASHPMARAATLEVRPVWSELAREPQPATAPAL